MNSMIAFEFLVTDNYRPPLYQFKVKNAEALQSSDTLVFYSSTRLSTLTLCYTF